MLALFARDRHTLYFGKFFNTGDKIAAVVMHNKIQRTAVCAATETMIKTLFGMHRK